jgi:programmed cell death protein 4
MTFLFSVLDRAALDKATVLLSMSKGGKRKDSVWGSGGGQQPVNHLVKEVLTESAY